MSHRGLSFAASQIFHVVKTPKAPHATRPTCSPPVSIFHQSTAKLLALFDLMVQRSVSRRDPRGSVGVCRVFGQEQAGGAAWHVPTWPDGIQEDAFAVLPLAVENKNLLGHIRRQGPPTNA